MKRKIIIIIVVVAIHFFISMLLTQTAKAEEQSSEVKSKKNVWRVKVLDDKTAGKGLPRPEWMFEVKRHWLRGTYRPPQDCSHDEQVFRATASGQTGHREAFLICDPISCRNDRQYARWRVKIPARHIDGARFSYVDTKDGPWQLWCNRDTKDPEKVNWFINVKKNGKWTLHQASSAQMDGGWFNMQVLIEPARISLTSCKNYDRNTLATLDHDSYPVRSSFRFGSAQGKDGGPEVISEFETLFVKGEPYHYVPGEVPDGPEDIRAEDNAICFLVGKTNPWNPRITEGDLIILKDGSWLLVYSDYHSEEGWDSSPARLSAKQSKDGGKTWSEPWVVAESGEGSSGNVMSVSLAYARNGDLLLTYHDKTPQMKAKAMVLRRSKNEGRTWGPRIPITPNNGNRHIANNACFRWLKGKRLILSCREYVLEKFEERGEKKVRWPYCLYSDDDGKTWKAGMHVPDPGLSDELKIGQNVNKPSIAELADGSLLMTMRSIAGGQFFSYSSDRGETWTTPYLSPLRGACSPATIKRILGTDDLLVVWTYGFKGRTPLVSAISSDGGKTWNHLKLVERSLAHGYCYTSITFVDDQVVLTYMNYAMNEAVRRHDVKPHYHDLRLNVLPVKWFYRDPVKYK